MTSMSHVTTPKPATLLVAGLLVIASERTPGASESFEFVAEHLPEAAMDNRFATLPLWSHDKTPPEPWQFTLQGAGARTTAGGLSLEGPMFSASVETPLRGQWSISAFGFFDALNFSGSDQRPLETLFTQPPLALPAEASFTDLHGTYRNIGAGFAFNLKKDQGWLGERQWVFGALYQRVELRDYRANYRVLEGPSSGATGFVDYSGDYTYVTPFAGLALPRHFESWSLTPHALFAFPFPTRAIQGRITGPGFDLSGDTDQAGHGKHFGRTSITIGLDVTYNPWGLSFDVGTLVSQALLEPLVHTGIEQNWVISVSKQF